MITNPLRHPFNMSVPSWPKPTWACYQGCFPRQPGSAGTVLGQESSSSKASSASCCELGRAVRAPARCQHFIPKGWGCGLGLYFQHSLPAPHTVPRVSNPPEPQQGHGASQTWVSYCHVTFPQAGGPHRSSSARGTGTAPEQSSHGVGRAGYPTSGLQGHTTFPSPSKSAQPGNCSESDNTGGEPPHCRRETRDSCGAAQSPSPLPSTLADGLQTHCHGKGTRHHLCDPAQAGGGAGGSCIHRCGSPTSPQATFPGKAQSVPSVLPSHLSTRSKAVVAQG